MTPRKRAIAVTFAAVALFGVATGAEADWTASGRFNYTDRLYGLSGFTGTAVVPVREADVEVYDLNSLAVLGSGASDGNGDFSIAIVDSSTRDVGVRMLASTDETPTLHFSVEDDGSGNAVYLYHDTTTDELGHGSGDDVAFGTMTMPAAIGDVATTDWSSQVFNSFDMLLLVADWIASVDGARPSVGLTIRWNPTNGRGGSSYSSGANRISLSDDDAYDDANILHEIGHYVEDEFGSSQNTGGSHFIGDDDQDPRLSWSEGVATVFSSASLNLGNRPRPDIYADRDSFGVSGGGGFAYAFESGVSGGSTNEKAVTAALWDVIDQASSPDASPGSDDDPMAGGDSSVWAVLEQMRIVDPPTTSLEDFWDLWFELGLGSQGDMQTIFAGHQVDFAADGQEPNDSPALATPLSVGASYLENSFFRSGAVAAGDEDWFLFPATAGDYYRIEVSGSTNTIYGRPDPELFLLDPDLEPLAFTDDPYDTSLNRQSSSTAQDMDETAPSILFQAAASGDHYLYLRHGSFPLNLEGRYGTYRIRVQNPSPPTPAVDAAAAQRMLPGESYQALVIGSDFATGANVTLSEAGLVVSEVHWIATTALVATVDVDPGVPDGSYSLTVTNPGGSSGVLPSAVEVSGSAQPPVVISEVQLGPDKVEIRNLGTGSADLTDWQISSFRPSSSVSTFTFPAYALPAGATVVVSESPGTDTATELFDPGGVFNWPWSNGRGGDVSLVDDGGRNVDYMRFVDGFVDEHEDPLGTGGLWMQPEILAAENGFTMSRAELVSSYRSRSGLSVSAATMPNGASGRANATDAWEDNDTPRRILLFSTDVTIPDLAISPRPGDSDEDWFGFAVSAGDAVGLEATFTHASGDLNMELYAPGDEASAILDAESTTDDEVIALTSVLTTLHGGGIYRVRVFGLSGATNSYALTLSGSGVCGNGVFEAGETCDDGNTDSGDCCSSTCQLEPNGTVCRVSGGVCDSVETCDGISDACPNDVFEPIETECRESAGACDAADFCDGLSSACPADLKLTDECRASEGVCDLAESCDGILDDCPNDVFEPIETECRESAGACDAADFCDGSIAACPGDLKLATECRAVLDLCDVSEICDGVSDDCPSDGFANPGTACGSATDNACTDPDTCDGSGACEANDATLGSACGDTGVPCMLDDTCNGSGMCTDNGFVTGNAACSSSIYDGFDYGTGDLSSKDGGTGDWKDPWSGASEIKVASPGFTYTDTSGNELTVSGNRVGKSGGNHNDVNIIDRTINSTVNSGTVWASALVDGHDTAGIHNVGLADGLFMGQGTKDSTSDRLGLADADGNTSLAPVSFSPEDLHFLVVRVDFSSGNEEAWLWIDPLLHSEPAIGAAAAHFASVKEFEFAFVRLQTTRRTAQAGLDEVRLGATFAAVTPHTPGAQCGNSTVEPGEDCDGGACCTPGCVFEPTTTECRSAVDVCDVAESCDGISDDCPVDGLEPIMTACRAAAGACDAVDFCDGLSVGCPTDVKLETECRAATNVCDVAESCDGVSDDCPGDGFQPITLECRASVGICDVAEFCTGSVAACPSDQVLNGMPCPDGDVCNGEEVCNELAVCVSGAALDCDDENLCTADACDATEGCSNESIPQCFPVPVLSPTSRLLFALAWAVLGGLTIKRRDGRGEQTPGPRPGFGLFW